MIRKLLLVLTASAAFGASAAPSVTSVELRQNWPWSKTLTVNYTAKGWQHSSSRQALDNLARPYFGLRLMYPAE